MTHDRGALSTDDIRLHGNLSEDDYAVLKDCLSREKLIESDLKGVNRRPMWKSTHNTKSVLNPWMWLRSGPREAWGEQVGGRV